MLTKAKAPYQVRYRPGDSGANALLKFGLLEVWKDRCYLCKTPVTFAVAEIDHIVPWTLPQVEVASIKAKYLTTKDAEAFGVHLVHNLAPACGGCNLRKSNASFEDVGALAIWLKDAHKKQAEVEKTVLGLRSTQGMQKALGKLLGADLSHPTSRQCLDRLGPALIDRLRFEAPKVLEGESAHEYRGEYSLDDEEPGSFWEGPLVTSVILDEGSRRAKVVLEDVFGWDFDEALDIAVRAVARAIKEDLALQIVSQAKEDGHYDPDVGSVEGPVSIAISEVRYEAETRTIHVRGSYVADGSAEVAVDDAQNDSGTEWKQYDTEMTEGFFEVPLWESDDDAKSGSGRCIAEAGDVELG